MSYITLRGHWYDIAVVNVHATTEDKANDTKQRLCEELERLFDHFPKHHTKILLGDFNARGGREDFLKPIIGKGSLHISNDNGVRAVIFATLKNLIVKTTRHATATQITCKYKHCIYNYTRSYSNTRDIHAVAPSAGQQNFNGYILMNF
jgi:hypothetical protein